jgi:uncharacterized membrane protein
MRNKLKNFGVDLADKVAMFVGSWKFIIIQSAILITWMFLNVDHLVKFDPYPFILMNLLLSAQAAYATPMILMSGNRQAQRDRKQALKDFAVDVDTNRLIKSLHEMVIKLDEDLKLDRQALKDHAEILIELKKLKTK